VTGLSAPIDAAGHVSEAREALRQAAATEPERWWTAEELRDAVPSWFPSTVVMAALNELVEQQELRLDNRLRIRYGG
jgi:hypothetical protein